MNKEVAYKKTLRCTLKALLIDIDRHLDKVEYKCLKREKSVYNKGKVPPRTDIDGPEGSRYITLPFL